jgi:hypothetical protein
MCPVSAPALRTDTQASRVTWRQIALSVRLRELRCSVLRSVVSIVTHSLTHSLTHSPSLLFSKTTRSGLTRFIERTLPQRLPRFSAPAHP